jgi:putative transposase
MQVRSCQYLNNVIEQDHRRVKQRIRPMLGFNQFCVRYCYEHDPR